MTTGQASTAEHGATSVRYSVLVGLVAAVVAAGVVVARAL